MNTQESVQSEKLQSCMSISAERAIRILAGSLVLVSVTCSYYTGNPTWLWLSVFVGVNLIQSAFTGFCPAEIVFKKWGLR